MYSLNTFTESCKRLETVHTIFIHDPWSCMSLSSTWYWAYLVSLVNIFTEYVKVGKYLPRGCWGEFLVNTYFCQKVVVTLRGINLFDLLFLNSEIL